MYIIGISALYHDSSVCLFKDNHLIFACEEEKFTGIKHDNSFPEMTLKHLYKTYNLNSKNIQAVCYYEDPQLKYQRVMENIKPQWFKNPIYSIKSYFKIKKNINEIDKKLKEISPNVFYSTHHEAHLYYAYYSSSFDEAVSLSVDGVGEIDTLSVGVCSNQGIKYKTLAKYPHSLGLYYSAMTSYLGFKPNEGEYKMMGLAPYGNYKTYIKEARQLVNFKNNTLTCNMDVFCWDRNNKSMFNEKLAELLPVQQRLPDETITQEHKDLAASIQKVYEEVFFDICKSLKSISKNTNLCLGGGCAYNGTANGKVINKTQFKHLWIPPAPSDAGSCIGAVIHYLATEKGIKRKISKTPFLGPLYDINAIRYAIGKREYKSIGDSNKLRTYIAQKINEGKVIGWYQGHIEFGSRALGNRSILANPTFPNMKDKINRVIKKREGFRPFAPMVSKDKQHQFFDMVDDVPYMNQVVKVRDEYRDKLPAITHVDGSARVQTVYKNTQIHDLLTEFEKLSGYPILLNTSFNVKDKTMVLTPKDAIDTFFDTEMDILVMANYIMEK